MKYVDDGCTVDKVNFETAETFAAVGGEKAGRVKHAVKTQNVFRAVVRKATSIGMKVNTSKTNLLVVSDAISYEPAAFIESSDGERIISGDNAKVLGFWFSRKPMMHLQVEHLRKKMRKRYWVLIHLKKFGFNEDELAKVYRTIVRPVLDHCCVVYHSMLNDAQDEELDRLQMHALRYIYGKDMSYARMREKAGVPTLRQRRQDLCDKFSAKCLTNERFKCWFPERNGVRSTRGGERFQEFFARCERLKNSPLYYMRRRLNGKEGKVVGKKNAVRRGGGASGPLREYVPKKRSRTIAGL